MDVDVDVDVQRGIDRVERMGMATFKGNRTDIVLWK